MSKEKVATPNYHTAANWQIALFAFNNTATNMYMLAMGYVSYYATGIAGLLVVLVSTILTSMRLFDGITDPIIGFLIDKTDTKFGKFRPFMIAGNIILAVTVLIMYNTTHLVPEAWRLIYFVAIYGVYIIGYTFQTACTKAAQSALTNHPKQRPMFSMYDGFYNAFLFAIMGFVVSNVLLPRHGGIFSIAFFSDLNYMTIALSALFTALAVIGIWKKDRTEFFGVGDSADKLKFKDYWTVLKGNRAIQMLVVAASTDKLAGTVARNTTVVIMLFGIVLGNYAFYGQLSMMSIIPMFIMIIFGVQVARKFGQKQAFVVTTWMSLILSITLFFIIFLGDLTTISMDNLNFITIAFMVVYLLMGGVSSICGNIVIPMIADCTDYETSISGRFVPGMMGTLFSFVDKLISSFGATIVGFALAAIGFTTSMPDLKTALTPELFWVTIALFFGLPMFGWIASIIAMKFYPLDDKKMAEVQASVAALKANAQ